MNHTANPGADSRPECLPLQELPWKRFEAFCRDLICRVSGVQDCNHYGTEGNAQEGIDLYADLPSGQRWAFQNKRWRTFGPSDVKNAVKATTYQADKYIILLSREATVGVRKEIDKHPCWNVWDVRDISQRVRELHLEGARRLVDAHFGPLWRRSFLGIDAVAAFLSPQDYFRPFTDERHRFNHNLPLVGRERHLHSLTEFAVSEQHCIAILSGRGGLGKSKLLFEFARWLDELHPQLGQRFLVDTVPVTVEGLDELPAIPAMVIVDDAHRRDDLAALFAAARHYGRPAKLLLATRPQAVDQLLSELTRAGFDPRKIVRLAPLADLTRDETVSLARAALGADREHLAERLAAVTRDCPMATVVGGRLLAEELLAPELLERHEDFQNLVLKRWSEEICGRLGTVHAPESYRRVLQFISITAPIPYQPGQYQRMAAEFLGISMPEFSQMVADLEAAGILVRRGYHLRIVPDLLSDDVLRQACLTPNNQPTGYALRVFESLRHICPDNVLRNLAVLDWRVAFASEAETTLLAEIWQRIEDEFRGGSHFDRRRWFDTLQKVAYYQPARMFALVQFAYRNPAPSGEIERLMGSFATDHHTIVAQLPDLLRRISFNLEYLPACLDLLWRMACDGVAGTNLHQEPAMSVLTDIASYDPEKPLAVNRTVLEAVTRWLRQSDAHSHAKSPLDVLDPLLAKSGQTTYSNGHGFVMRSFVLRQKDVRDIRDGALELLRQITKGTGLRVILRALKSLGYALHDPVSHPSPISMEDQLQWEDEQKAILTILHELAVREKHPVCQYCIRQTLHWPAKYSASQIVRKGAREIIASIPRSFEFRLTCLMMPPERQWYLLEDEFTLSPVAEAQFFRQNIGQFIEDVAVEFCGLHSGAAAIADALDSKYEELGALGIEANLGQIFHGILLARPAFVEEIGELILANPTRHVAQCFPITIVHISQHSDERYCQFIHRAAASPAVMIRRSVAQHFAWRREWTPNEIAPYSEVILALVQDEDMDVRQFGLVALRHLRHSLQSTITIALSADIGCESKLAEELCESIVAKSGIGVAALPGDVVQGLLLKLEPINDLGHWACEFLTAVAQTSARTVIEMLLRRIARNETYSDHNFSPLPFRGLAGAFQPLVGTSDHHELLRLVRDFTAPDDDRSRFWLPKLYRLVSAEYCQAGLEVLNEWFDSLDPVLFESAASLLSEAKHDFVFDKMDFVVGVLERAEDHGDDCAKGVAAKMRSCATRGLRQGLAGKPFPQDIELRERATAARERFSPGTQAYAFFDALLRQAEHDISDTKLRAEETEGS